MTQGLRASAVGSIHWLRLCHQSEIMLRPVEERQKRLSRAILLLAPERPETRAAPYPRFV